MPELPEVTLFKQYLDATSLHQEIEKITVLNDLLLKEISVQKFSKQLIGQQFESAMRRGKYLLIELSPGKKSILMHFGMTGSLSYYKGDEELPEYGRVIFHFSNGYNMAYCSQRMLGEIKILDNATDYIEEHKLGVDAMADELTEDRFRKLMNQRKGIVKSVLMNQEVISGIGNEFSDEILFHSKIHPKTKIQDLSEEQVGTIYSTMREVLQIAIDHRANYRELKKSFLLANRETGSKCPECHTKLETIQVSGRTAYYCPNCQTPD